MLLSVCIGQVKTERTEPFWLACSAAGLLLKESHNPNSGLAWTLAKNIAGFQHVLLATQQLPPIEAPAAQSLTRWVPTVCFRGTPRSRAPAIGAPLHRRQPALSALPRRPPGSTPRPAPSLPPFPHPNNVKPACLRHVILSSQQAWFPCCPPPPPPRSPILPILLISPELHPPSG